MDRAERLIVVSNRLPFALEQQEKGGWKVTPGSGGLVTALLPVLKHRGGVWVGWPGTTEATGREIEESLASVTRTAGYSIKPVHLSPSEVRDYYAGFCNEAIWPLFHDFPAQCNFRPEYWKSYRRANGKFADAVEEVYRPGDYLWVHDYHLMGLGADLRARNVQSPFGFFLHIPFPPLDIYLKLPWRFHVLESLLAYDLVGFQTERDRRNFLQCVRALMPDAAVRRKGQLATVDIEGRQVRLGSFAIAMDYEHFSQSASSPQVERLAHSVREELPDREIVLGVDRLDYTKGLPNKLEAYRNALARYPDLIRNVTLVQVVVPSREHVPDYAELKREVERLVGEINGEFTQPGWVPIHYQYRRLRFEELLAYYRAAEIALVTPLKDGMNLVCKEFCACSQELDSVLILSESAGAAAQLHRGALMVNPYDVEGVADALHTAFRMPFDERKRRMRTLRRIVKRYDIFWWVDSFLKTAFQRELRDFPVAEDYVPARETATQKGTA